MKKIKKTGLISLSIIILISLFLFIWIPTTPEYSLYQTVQAFAEHDYTKFQKYADTNSIINGLVDQALEEATKSQPTSGFGADFASGLLEMMRPQLTASLESQIKTAIEKGEIGDINATKLKLNLVNFLITKKIDNLSIKDKKPEGKKLTITLMADNQKVFLIMNRRSNWVLTGINPENIKTDNQEQSQQIDNTSKNNQTTVNKTNYEQPKPKKLINTKNQEIKVQYKKVKPISKPKINSKPITQTTKTINPLDNAESEFLN